jgi:hypothetical protein
MKELIVRDKPILFVEIYQGRNSNKNPDGTINMLLELGYKAYIVNSENKLEDYTTHSDSNYNYFFIYE